MTIRKQYPPRDYETSTGDTPSGADRLVDDSPTSYSQTDSDKSRSAAVEAQRLASQGSWADTFTGGTPATNQTPAASTVDGDERNLQFPLHSQEPDPSDPPPLYTPSDTTVPSPVIARSVAGLELVSASVTVPSSHSQSQFPYRDDDDDDDDDDEGDEEYNDDDDDDDDDGTFLPEPVQHQGQSEHHHQRSTDGKSRLPVIGDTPSLSPKPSSPWPPDKREQHQHETSQSIRGTYQLYDLLDLSTTSGSITVDIEVQPGDKPAVLRLATTSGSVRVRMTSRGGLFSKRTINESVRERTFVTEISTSSGSISGDIIHGNGGSTRISAHSASINLDIFTVGVSEDDPASRISTTTNSGSQNLRLVAPLGSSEPVRAIGASHNVLGSGSMNIRYPMEWEGMVHVLVQGSGSVSANGQGLIVRRQNSNELYGYKGNKEGRTVEIFEQGSGSIRFAC
ncbi:hypothetical protein A1O1_05947 [Capronia coronata CBS 617.96]|uniref:Uncharacterized protein n=1 Tax=Capronia coronata CBS 617.96 TaxID=1182541 RepID=W9XYG2_9EURO|nr:uncharacterized protein A1O1_05947 [Capronia coronata CBS 617.96]EXJ85582.1 hypothetical protein A1O1_05947 [Capronia coronata CBS 617.96]